MSPRPLIHLAVALDGTGWHPASWRDPSARADEVFTARYWADLVRLAESGALDLVTLEDGLALQADDALHHDDRTDRLRGRLDAVLVANRVGPLVRRIGLVPIAITTHTEPFHLSKSIATLDYVTGGRAGVQVRIGGRRDEADHFGRRELGDWTDLDADGQRSLANALFDETDDYVEVLRRLWDSWEDDAEIRDSATGRFVDRDKLHYIDFEGDHFSVRGPSITPRPPQGQPLIAALGHDVRPWQLIGRSADLGFITPKDDPAEALTVIREAQQDAGRDTVHVLGDVLVVLDEDAARAGERLGRLNDLAGSPLVSDALIYVGGVKGLADLIESWSTAGLSGARLRPAVNTVDLPRIVDDLVPELRRRGLFRSAYDDRTLRERFGLARPVSRYAA
ncbi:LLM class flavin-dependent oxidoreductase [Luteipulveratus mongoliensis]|uniref:FMNH2-utilizing monooxygenase n=1 Tax=Luteipulveratus mongoliensis TaxID=571913 RepID=A0A0K1JN49_9MICO|nr:LLM class flavin-dependent oxidoreductase [Luteipulveratus mongoliensis]AKU18013.1 FMNH2-utilizing monooxygenase [Luteipulveratus mongoliensis]